MKKLQIKKKRKFDIVIKVYNKKSIKIKKEAKI